MFLILIYVHPVGQIIVQISVYSAGPRGLDNGQLMGVCEETWVINFQLKSHTLYILIPCLPDSSMLIPWAFHKVHVDTGKAFPMINYMLI